MDLACDIDEAATLHPTTSHETALTIAAITGKPLLIPHSALANGDEDPSRRRGSVGSTERRPSVESPAGTPKGGGSMEPGDGRRGSGLSSMVTGAGATTSGPGSLVDGPVSPKGGNGKERRGSLGDSVTGAGAGGKAADGKDGKGAGGRWWSLSRLTACFDFRADRKVRRCRLNR